MGESRNLRSSYLEYLPAFLQNDRLLNGFLLAFEQVLSSLPLDKGESNNRELLKNRLLLQADKDKNPGVEQVIDNISAFFDPDTTPDEFLPWLAGWVALSLRDDWDERAKRKFIRHISHLYRLRGTKAGLEKMLELYVNPDLDLNQDSPQIKNEIKNVKIYEHFGIPHYFQVEVRLKTRSNELEQQKRIILSIIDQEKPAHTFYALRLTFPTMKILDRLEGARKKIWEHDIEPHKQDKKVEKPLEELGIWVGITTRLGVLETDTKAEEENKN